jgi:hypothetical protein
MQLARYEVVEEARHGPCVTTARQFERAKAAGETARVEIGTKSNLWNERVHRDLGPITALYVNVRSVYWNARGR